MTSQTPETPDDFIPPLEDRHIDYLKDESRTSGTAQSISFPETEKAVQTIVQHLLAERTPITVQGSRTGITGGAVPCRGHVLNLSKMTGITGLSQDSQGGFLLEVQPGLTLLELTHRLQSGHFDTSAWDQKSLQTLGAFKNAPQQFWPPDPTETSASVGGMAASNSRGICAHHYGPTSHHIKGIRVVDAAGKTHALFRGHYLFSQGICPLPGGGDIHLEPSEDGAPSSIPAVDLMDLYLGGEGMLGVITALTLSLQPLPQELWGIVFFFEAEACALAFIKTLVQREKTETTTDIVAIEFMDETTLECIREYKKENSQLRELPDWDDRFTSTVYLEIHGNNTDEVENLSQWLMETTQECGGDPDATWAFCGEGELERLRRFRHAAPASVNHFIDRARQTDPRITKLGTDMALKNCSLPELMAMYRRELKTHELKAAIFGHAGGGHFHVNILPRRFDDFQQGKKCMAVWAQNITARGGHVVMEHGVGKIKKNLFQNITLPRHLQILRCVKQQLDPKNLWNPGNMDIQDGETDPVQDGSKNKITLY